MPLARIALVPVAGLLSLLPARAAAQWQEQVDNQLRAVEASLSERGFRRMGDVRTGSVDSGERESIALALEGHQDYVIVGVCDNDCSDLDLYLYDGRGTQVDVDVEMDDAPVVEVTPSGSGSYQVDVVMATCSVSPCFYGVEVFVSGGAAAQRVQSEGPRFESGTLSVGDDTLGTGEYVHLYSIDGTRGDQVVIDLRSSEFDPYLILRKPDGGQEENDDHEGNASRSLLSLTLDATGSHDILVTSYRPRETGAYGLEINQVGSGGSAMGSRVERGALLATDDTLRSGEAVDVYRLDGRPGLSVRLDLTSDDFDTYLILQDPAGQQVENDDADRPGHSMIEHDLTELGEYRIMVTSYEAGESGGYELAIDLSGAAPVVERRRDVATLAVGGSSAGSLGRGDGQLESGEYRDIYVFNGTEGDGVSVEMTSSQFDTYLIVVTPEGDTIQNDDDEGNTSKSRIDLVLRETGRYRIIATSYRAGDTGQYEVSLAPVSSAAVVSSERVAREESSRLGSGQTFGLFMGISDYGGRANDLAYTADDAVRVQEAIIRGGGMPAANSVLLTDGNATVSAFRGAVGSLARRMGPDDTFVFFFSGHGSRVPRSDFQPSDPDALDETLELYDASIKDDEMRVLLEEVPAGRVILLFDACFSGGFSKDVISVPGRMGMFSSEEDVTSSVAAKFRAGGYLALFLADAIGDRLGDADGDGELTAIELSQYVHERYRADVKSGMTEFVRTGGPQMGYQHLVVDRGSIGPYDVLFRW